MAERDDGSRPPRGVFQMREATGLVLRSKPETATPNSIKMDIFAGCSRVIARHLWVNTVHRGLDLCVDDGFEKIMERFSQAIGSLGLPSRLEGQILKECANLAHWVMYVTTRIWFPLEYTFNIHWTGQGDIDIGRIIEEWRANPQYRVDPHLVYITAAEFRLDVVSMRLWEEFSEQERHQFEEKYRQWLEDRSFLLTVANIMGVDGCICVANR